MKHVGRIAFGFRNPDNQRRRVRWACTRQSRQAPPRPANYTPIKSVEPDNSDNNTTGVNIENMNFQRGDDGDDVVRSINQQGMAVAGQWLNRGYP